MRVILKVSLVAIVMILVMAGASKGDSLVHKGASLALNSATARVITQPQTEEPRGPNVFIWYCCIGERFHSVAVNSGGQADTVELEWGTNYQSVSIRLPNCRGGKVEMSVIEQGLNEPRMYHYVYYAVSGTLLPNATMANCDVIADLYQNGQIVNSQDFRVFIQ
jgi:hypothetical protein